MDAKDSEASPKISWDWGMAYDLFFSLSVLHSPAEFGLRGAWAKGVRSRLPVNERKTLEEAAMIIHYPLPWIFSLPDPKDAETAIRKLGDEPAAERLFVCCFGSEDDSEMATLFRDIGARGSWTAEDLEKIQEMLKGEKSAGMKKKHFETMLNWWANPAQSGDRYLDALRAYYEVFFAEEEVRIRPYLQEALERAQELADKMSFDELLVELSQGIRFISGFEMDELVLVPSYWITPLVTWGKLGENKGILAFGGRPSDASLVPGEAVPDALLGSLKAMADPTRLRILRYLASESLTPTQLSHRLRLRAPTVVHHLKRLRLARLVYLSLEDGGEKRYALRDGSIANIVAELTSFLEKTDAAEQED